MPNDSAPSSDTTAYTFYAGTHQRIFHEPNRSAAFDSANAWVRSEGLAPDSFAWFDSVQPNSYRLGDYGVWD